MINEILAAGVIGRPEPEVGMGATMLMHSDRHACTIIAVTHFKTGPNAGRVKTVEAQQDHAQRIDRNGMGDNQHYVYLPNPKGPTRTYTLRKNGRFISTGGTVLAIGYRDEHYDFSL